MKINFQWPIRACVVILLVGLPTSSPAQTQADVSPDANCWSTNQTQAPEGRFDPIRRRIQERIASGRAVSIAVAVAVGGTIVWQEACGWADRERRVRATPYTPYGAASISKAFTATGLMVLVQRGAVDLNHPVNDYLGRAKLTGFGGDAAAATVKLVLQHKAGLAIHGNSFYADEAYRRPSLDETIMRYGIIVRPPGEAYNYSNLGFGVIERVIERTSGSKFEDFMRAEVFQPLGLDRTSVGPMTPLEEQTAVGYDDGKRLSARPDTDARGAGYIYSSANDLVRFGMFRLKEHLPGQRQILSDSMIDRMANDTTPTGSAGSETYENGLGWAITHNASGSGLTITGHTGAGLGGAGVLWLVPEKRIAVAVLANSIRAGTVSLTMDIFDLLIPELKAQRAKNALSSQPSIPKAAFRPPPELIGSWKGEVDTWNGKIPVRMEVRTDGDIHIKMGDQWDTLETLLNNVQFHDGELSGSFAGIIPTEDANRHHYNVLLDRLVLRGDTLSGAAVADAGPYYALASWIKLVRQAPAK